METEPFFNINTSLIGLFLQASWPVKLVMVMLILTSLWTWALIIERFFFFRKQKHSIDTFEEKFWSGASMEQIYRAFEGKYTVGMAAIFMSAIREWKRSFSNSGKGAMGLQARLDRSLDSSVNREVEKLNNNLGILATVGSAAPFVGLLGTVIGIMDAFQSIAASKNTSLAVVAPGIAEALLATALGLFVAIPAVIAYNRFSEKASRLSHRLEVFSDELSVSLSRQAVGVMSNNKNPDDEGVSFKVDGEK